MGYQPNSSPVRIGKRRIAQALLELVAGMADATLLHRTLVR